MKFHKTIDSLRVCFRWSNNKFAQHRGQYLQTQALTHPWKWLLYPSLRKCKSMWSLIGCVLAVVKCFALTVNEMWDLSAFKWYFKYRQFCDFAVKYCFPFYFPFSVSLVAGCPWRAVCFMPLSGLLLSLYWWVQHTLSLSRQPLCIILQIFC